MINPAPSLVIPALNESKIITNHILEIHSWMAENLRDTSYEVIVARSTILFFVLVLFLFLASQPKKYFEKKYIRNARINVRLERFKKQGKI